MTDPFKTPLSQKNVAAFILDDKMTVKVHHMPTNIVVSVNDTKSPRKNRDIAIARLELLLERYNKNVKMLKEREQQVQS